MPIVFYYMCTQSLSVTSFGPGKAVSLEFNLLKNSRRQRTNKSLNQSQRKGNQESFFCEISDLRWIELGLAIQPQKPEMQISSLASDPQGWLPSSENLAAVAEGVGREFFPLPRKNVLWLRRSNWIGILDRGNLSNALTPCGDDSTKRY